TPVVIHSRTRQWSSLARAAGTGTPSRAAPSSLRPRASTSKKPSGGSSWVLTNTVRPSLSRARRASQIEPPPTAVTDATGVPSRRVSRSVSTALTALRLGLDAEIVADGVHQTGHRLFDHVDDVLERLVVAEVRIRDVELAIGERLGVVGAQHLDLRPGLLVRGQPVQVGEVVAVHDQDEVVGVEPVGL